MDKKTTQTGIQRLAVVDLLDRASSGSPGAKESQRSLQRSARPQDKHAADIAALGGPELRVFRHPVARVQIPKGSVEPNESAEIAALRELAEESGMSAARVLREIGYHEIEVGAGPAETGPLELQIWHTFLLAADKESRDTWSHRVSGSEGEEGLNFEYFWLPIAEARRASASRFHASIDFVTEALASEPTHFIEPALMLHRDSLARTIASVATLRGEFTLRSGAVSQEYFDKYRFESDPALLKAIAEHLAPMISPQTQVLAGLELGGVPIATALALRSGLRTVFCPETRQRVRNSSARGGTGRSGSSRSRHRGCRDLGRTSRRVGKRPSRVRRDGDRCSVRHRPRSRRIGSPRRGGHRATQCLYQDGPDPRSLLTRASTISLGAQRPCGFDARRSARWNPTRQCADLRSRSRQETRWRQGCPRWWITCSEAGALRQADDVSSYSCKGTVLRT